MYVTADSLNLDQFGSMKRSNCLKNALVRSFALALPMMKWPVVHPARKRQQQFPWCSYGFWCIVDLQRGRALAHGASQNGLKGFRFWRTPRVRAHKYYCPCSARRATPRLYRTSCQALENWRTRIMLKISWFLSVWVGSKKILEKLFVPVRMTELSITDVSCLMNSWILTLLVWSLRKDSWIWLSLMKGNASALGR